MVHLTPAGRVKKNHQLPSARLWKRFIVSSYLRYIPYWKTPPLPLSQPPKTKPPASLSSPSLLSNVVKQLPRTQRRLLDGLEQVWTDAKIFKAFRSKGKLHLASDGGLHNNSATTAGYSVPAKIFYIKDLDRSTAHPILTHLLGANLVDAHLLFCC